MSDSLIRTHRNFLGWYNADEPENIVHRDKDRGDSTYLLYYQWFQGQTRVPNYPYFKQRYDFIKHRDRNHAVFVTYAGAENFARYFQQVPPNDWPTDLPERWKWNTYSGKFYDVQMIDMYPFYRTDPQPSPRAQDVEGPSVELRNNHLRINTTDTTGSAMYVGQGAGISDFSLDQRNFDLRELTFSIFQSMYGIQLPQTAGRIINMSGLFFWAHGVYAPQVARDTVAAFMTFFNTHRLDSVISGINRNTAIREVVMTGANSGNSWQNAFFAREYNNSYYLIILNRFDRNRPRTPKEASIQAQMSLPTAWQNVRCEELIPNGGTRVVDISPVNAGVFRFTEPLTFRPLEAKIFRYSPSMQQAVAGEKTGSNLQNAMTNFSFGNSNLTNEQTAKKNHAATLVNLSAAPNPANQHVKIQISLQENIRGSVKMMDLAGRCVFEHSIQEWNKGEHIVEISTKSFASGNYLLTFSANGYQKVLSLSIVH